MADEMTPAAGRPYRHGDVPRALIDAALASIERTGEADFTLRSLARDIGVTHAAPYAHFDNKDAVLNEVRQIGYERLVAALRESIDGAAGREVMRLAGCTYVAFGRQNPGLYRLMFSGTDQAPQTLDDVRGQSAAILTQAVNAARPDDPESVRFDLQLAAFSMMHGLTSLIIDNRIDVDDERVESVIDAVMRP